LKEFFIVFLGGGLGSAVRYSIGYWFSTTAHSFPYPTLIANLLGCLLIGIFMGLASKLNWIEGPLLLLFAVGFCGGLTTFSALSYQNVEFLINRSFFLFLTYTSVSFIGGIGLVVLGSQISKYLA